MVHSKKNKNILAGIFYFLILFFGMFSNNKYLYFVPLFLVCIILNIPFFYFLSKEQVLVNLKGLGVVLLLSLFFIYKSFLLGFFDDYFMWIIQGVFIYYSFKIIFSFLEKTVITADIIFADPPYDFTAEQFGKIAELVNKNKLINQDGLLIIEHSKHTDLSEVEGYTDERKYGGSVFSFFEFE